MAKARPDSDLDALPAELDFGGMVQVIGRGIHAGEMRGERPLKVTYAVAGDSSLAFTLDDGRRVEAPLEWYPRLRHASPAERNDWRLILGGRAVLWRALGLAISARALLEGTRADESAASLRKWLAGRNAEKRKTA